MPEGDWRLLREQALPGAEAMAYDEAAARTAATGGPRTVRLYRWRPSTLSLGYRQSAESVDWAACERAGVDVIRRNTGGGGIYHDTYGDVSYSVIAPADEVPGDLLETYELFCEPLFDAFDALGVDARFVAEEHAAVHEPACYLRALHPAHDIVAGDGRKLSGNAQYRRKDAVIQHGSITFRSEPERHLDCFAADDVTPADFDGRVTSLLEQNPDLTRADVVAALEDALAEWAGAEEGEWTEAERDFAEERADEKYRSEAWTRRRDDPTS
ncbi:lipoate--protein ligase family protein [Halosegnis marinus]|uniref:Biotin/lipoate A/B protein ligase family protein n=1 Tax=Halosegnis marinus TaxID=3034023 RepID=A0ABD5ZMS7_9EURY|nr:biotin/lipoate A/B protein ligase family protein [Halosegnis sp. DT85]